MLVEGEWTLPALRAAAGMCAVKFGLYDIPAGGGRAGQSRARPRAAGCLGGWVDGSFFCMCNLCILKIDFQALSHANA